MKKEIPASSPRVQRGGVELYIPHGAGTAGFAYPSAEKNTYWRVRNKILGSGYLPPAGDYTASLLHVAYGCTPEAKKIMDEPEFKDVKDKLQTGWLWVFNRNLWASQGVYVVQDTDSILRGQPLRVKNLEKVLRGGVSDKSGVRFSKDGSVRFAPKGSYKGGYHSSESFAKDGFVIASFGREGAEKLGELSKDFSLGCYIGVANRLSVMCTPIESGVSVLGEYDCRLHLFGDEKQNDRKATAFGVMGDI